jgi:Flp pilus assembly protein TadB
MSNQYLLNLIAGRDPNIRAGDADRERVAERLRKSHTEGRLDMEEFQQRLERCYQARTFGDLAELVRDLPRSEQPQSGRAPGSPRWRLAPFAVILAFLFLISVATSHHHGGFWLWVPLLFIFWRLSAWRRRRWVATTRRGPGDWI